MEPRDPAPRTLFGRASRGAGTRASFEALSKDLLLLGWESLVGWSVVVELALSNSSQAHVFTFDNSFMVYVICEMLVAILLISNMPVQFALSKID